MTPRRAAAMLLAAMSVAQRAPAQRAEAPSHEIAAALLPLPEPLRAGTGVVRLDSLGVPAVLRPSTNGMMCIADRPGDAEFDVRCYEERFIVVVYRQFQLRAAKADSVGRRIEREIASGKITLSRQPTAGYRCLGPSAAYTAAADSIGPAIKCWQSVHFPYATARELGLVEESQLPDSAKARMPYVMASGTYWSHVMIEHP
jgi:hypothetical protein